MPLSLKIQLLWLGLLFYCLKSVAQTTGKADAVCRSLSEIPVCNQAAMQPSSPYVPQKKSIFKQFIEAFNATDTTYITPNKYNWAFMVQNTNSFENYKLHSKSHEQQLVFSPKPAIRFGPYLGWRWIFLGYTFEINSLGNGTRSRKTEFELSLYSSMLGCDLIYRRTGNDFRLRKIKGFGEQAESVEGTTCNGINVKVTGVNLYYIFNHKRFSYPAAFAQSTVQRKSCGTWKAGISCTQHELNFDYQTLSASLPQDPDYQLSPDFTFNKIKYTDISLSCGYAYNWVFKPNFLLCVSMSPAVGYKHTQADAISLKAQSTEAASPSPLNLDNFNFDVIGRIGLVWNNTRYFAGMSLIIHNYNYRHDRLSINNTFGTLNFYIGLNFHKRKAYR